MNIDYPKNNIDDLKKLWNEAFGDGNDFLNMFFEKIYSPERCLVAYENKQTAAALYWFDTEFQGHKLAYIYAVATFKSFRGKGICQKLMADTHSLLKEKGYAGSVLVPGESSLFDFYGRMGYKAVCHINKFTVAASGEKINVKKTDKSEYTCLRKKYLPSNGIIQENESIDFLNELYGLYAGDDFVMAANVKDGVLHCAEFLGNDKLCPGITESLGCSTGNFRTPGDSIPFAMYLPFSSANISVPGYFGLAFD